MKKNKAFLGFGLGLRTKHYNYIIEHQPDIDWFEIITDNYLVPGGKPLHYLDQIRENYPIAMHGVSLSIGSVDPLNKELLQGIKQLANRINPVWISDHLCWTGIDGKNMHDLLPLPYTEEALNHVVQRIKEVQDYLGQQILIENVSSYITYKQSGMTEWDFLTAIAEQADCLILLDINNIYVSGFNHHFNPEEYLNAVPIERVQQFHLAGHTNEEIHLTDTHDHEIIPNVWDLFAKACERFGPVATMIERDDHIPELPVLEKELVKAKEIASAYWEIDNVYKKEDSLI